MKHSASYILILCFLAGAIYFFYSHKGDERKNILEKKIIIPGRIDKSKKNLAVNKIKIDSTEILFWKKKYDSLHAVIASIDTARATAQAETTFAHYYLPFQAVVNDSLTTNYLTISPLNPQPTRVRIDSTRYDTLRIAYTDTTIITRAAIRVETVIVVCGGAAIGSAIAGSAGAAIGASIGFLIDWIIF